MTEDTDIQTNDDSEVTISPAEALANLKQRADRLGVKYHPSISYEKLAEKVRAHLESNTSSTEEAAPAAAQAPAQETEAQRRGRLRREAMALVRIRVTCMNPAKKEWEGELFTAGNSYVPSVTKYVPFNISEGWHVPQIILKQIQARQCTVFVTGRDAQGRKTRVPKQIKEFAVEILDPLTPEELAELARRQAASNAID